MKQFMKWLFQNGKSYILFYVVMLFCWIQLSRGIEFDYNVGLNVTILIIMVTATIAIIIHTVQTYKRWKEDL